MIRFDFTLFVTMLNVIWSVVITKTKILINSSTIFEDCFVGTAKLEEKK